MAQVFVHLILQYVKKISVQRSITMGPAAPESQLCSAGQLICKKNWLVFLT
jgi:hypothetical protein